MIPTIIRITPTTCGSTVPPFELTAQARIAPKAIRIRLMTNPIADLVPRRDDSNPWQQYASDTVTVVTLTVVPDETEAEIVRGLLRKHGIKSSHRGTVLTSSVWPVGSTAPVEVIVDETDLSEARRILERHTR